MKISPCSLVIHGDVVTTTFTCKKKFATWEGEVTDDLGKVHTEVLDVIKTKGHKWQRVGKLEDFHMFVEQIGDEIFKEDD